MNILVSVIIPVYNVERWIRESLDSVCEQALQDIEIICVNDGSPDRSLEILKEYATRDDRIVIIDKENEGVGAARNDGIRAARGEYVAFMDPDDKYPDPDTLKLLYDAAKEHDVLVAGGYFGCINEKGERIKKSRCYYGVDFTCSGLMQYQDFQCDYQFQAYIFQRDFLLHNELFFPTYSRFQDPPFFVHVMTVAGKFFAVNKVTYLYRPGMIKSSYKFEKAFDLLCGITDNLELSKTMGYSTLHYISAMRLLSDGSKLVELLIDDERCFQLIWKFIQTAGKIDVELATSSGHALPDPILPELFIHLLNDSKKYKKLRARRAVRAYEKLFVS